MAWPVEIVLRALMLADEGWPDQRIGARLGVPPASVRNWRRGRVPERARRRRSGDYCPHCDEAHELEGLPSEDYAYLLGMYLGDGCLAATSHHVSLRIAQDAAYPGIIEEARATMEALGCGHKATVIPSPRDNSVVITSYGRHWLCLFPQHGPGRKHQRRIALEPWQEHHVRAAPGRFLRGLIHSDGWRGVNRVVAKGRPYEYPRYQFSSRSDDIRQLFTDTCDLLGIAWRPWGRWHISVARRDAVALLDEHVGPKY